MSFRVEVQRRHWSEGGDLWRIFEEEDVIAACPTPETTVRVLCGLLWDVCGDATHAATEAQRLVDLAAK